MRGERLGKPRREFAEGALRRVSQPCQQQGFVSPNRLDERRAGAVRARGDMTDERRRFEGEAARERHEDDQPLARLKVQRDPDRELAVRFELPGRIEYRHRFTLSPFGWAGRAHGRSLRAESPLHCSTYRLGSTRARDAQSTISSKVHTVGWSCTAGAWTLSRMQRAVRRPAVCA